MELKKIRHDEFIKRFMSHPEVAKDFFYRYLPADLRKKLDLDSLQAEKSSFVDKRLRSKHSDIIFSCKMHGSKEAGYLYCLVEHQSSSDEFMPFRLINYCFRLLEYHFKNDANRALPLVIPMVIYNGKVKIYSSFGL